MKNLKLLYALCLMATLINSVSAAYTGTYGFDDIENSTGDLTVKVLVGVSDKGLLIGRMTGLTIALGMVVGVVALIFGLILLLKNRGKSLRH